MQPLPRAAAVAVCLLAGCGESTATSHSAGARPREHDWWTQRHEQINRSIKERPPDLIFIGDSLVQAWEVEGLPVWREFYEPRNAANLGVRGDLAENVVWRLENGNLDGIRPRLAVVLVGTNDAAATTPEVAVRGIKNVVRTLRERLPETRILLLGVFPRQHDPTDRLRRAIVRINSRLKLLDDGARVTYRDIGQAFLADGGVLPVEVMPDGLHPSERGYAIWAEAIEPDVRRLMEEGP